MYLRPFDLKTATMKDWEALHRFDATIHAEFWGDRPHPPFEQFVRDTRHEAPLWETRRYAMWNGQGDIVGLAAMWISRTGRNKHLMEATIDVLPEWRRQGIARWLLAPIVTVACRHGIRLLKGVTSSASPAGEAFMRRLGGKPAMTTSTNVLAIADVDRALLRRWIETGETSAADFALEELVGPYPDDWLGSISALYDAANDAPRGDLDAEDERRSPELLREMEAVSLARGDERWTMIARHRPTGEIAGFTETHWNAVQPEGVSQAWTVVLPRYRGHGLGRWLKAAMLEKVLRQRLTVQWISTGNADSNAPMLRINYELGFKPYRSWIFWQLEVGQAQAYLAEKAAEPLALEAPDSVPA